MTGQLLECRFNPVSSFDAFFQPLDEPRGGCTIDNIVVDGHSETEQFSGSISPSTRLGLRSMPPTVICSG